MIENLDTKGSLIAGGSIVIGGLVLIAVILNFTHPAFFYILPLCAVGVVLGVAMILYEINQVKSTPL